MNPFTKWLISLALSKSGRVVRWAVGLLIGAIGSQGIIPSKDLPIIEQGLLSGAMALVTLAYAWLQYFLYRKTTDQTKDLQASINAADPQAAPLKVDGYIGDETIAAFTARTGIEVRRAIAVHPVSGVLDAEDSDSKH